MRRACTFLFLLTVLLASSPGVVSGQVTRADSAAVLLGAAHSFQAQGRWEVAEALYQYITERFGGTPAAADAQAALRAPEARTGSRRSQVELQVWSTLYGVWLGVAIPAALGADGPEPYGVGLLLGGPGGFLAGRALARSRSLSEGQVRAITFGSTWGTWQGLGWLKVLDWGEDEVCDLDFCYTEDTSGEDVMKSLVLGGLAGIAAGAFLAQRPISMGTATTVTFGGMWGTWFGVAGGVLADLEGDDLWTATLLGGNAGLVGAALMDPAWNFSRERARLISIAGVVGGLAGAGLDLLAQPDDEKVAIAIPLLGSIVGLGLGAAWTAERAPEGGAFQEGDATPPAAAVMQIEEGRLALGLPSPFPTMLRLDTPRGVRVKPALGMTLLQARF